MYIYTVKNKYYCKFRAKNKFGVNKEYTRRIGDIDTMTKTEAKIAGEALRNKIINDSDPLNKSSITVYDICNEFINRKGVSYSIYTLRTHQNKLDKYIKPYIGKIKIKDLRHYHLQKMVNDMLVKGLSPRTAKLTKSLITGSLNYALKMEFIKTLPNTNIDVPAHLPPEIDILTPEQAEIVFEYAAKSKGYVPLMVLFQTMMRRGELCGLKRSDIDFDHNILYIKRHLNYLNRQVQVKLPKNNKTREIMMTDFIKQLLLNYLKDKDLKDSDFLFSDSGKPFLPPTTLNYYYLKIVKTIKQERNIVLPTSLHAIRHFVISQLIASGVPLEVVSQMAGHSSVNITSKIYTHIKIYMQKQAMNALNSFVKNASLDVKQK